MLRISFFMQDGWPLCDFQEYIYGPKSHWYYTEEQIKEFESGKEKWPCERAPRPRCKCGILARRGVVPTELGYGWYCGNSFGLFWVNHYFPFHACLSFLFVIQLANTFDVV